MSQAIQSPGFRPAVSASTATASKTKRKAQPALGSKRLPFPCLPFVTDQAGRAPSLCWFDVPAEDYGPGSLTGMQAFTAFMEAKRTRVKFHELSVLQEVFAALQEPSGAPSRRGAAVGFLAMMTEWQQLAAGLVDFAGLVSYRRKELQQRLAQEAARKENKSADFAARMCAAKLAKRAAAAAQGVRHD